jgi:hypothetical protein
LESDNLGKEGNKRELERRVNKKEEYGRKNKLVLL